MDKNHDYYLPDEERFGFFTSHMYNLFSGIGPMRKFHQFTLEGILSKKPKKLLDVGFGTGIVLKKLLQLNDDMEVFGVDPSTDMLKVASRKLRRYISENKAKLALGSSRDIPFDEKFDVIYSSLSFHHWKNQEQSIQNILKFLAPDGRFMIFEYGDDLIRGYKRAVKSHALSLTDLEKIRSVADFEIHDSGEFRCVSFKSPQKGKT